jgi:ubiquinone/menaquinone biosynthesis C-methylase UbiE
VPNSRLFHVKQRGDDVTRICNYENSRYRYEFWEGAERRYEDLCERIAIRALLPPTGDTLLDIGAGYGRLAPLYAGYRQVVLLDYARSQLEEARRYLSDLDRYTLVMADVYRLPFVENRFDAVTMVRVMHHLADVPAALAEVHRITAPRGATIIEHANKRNWKSVARWLLRRQSWNPFERTPVEFVEMNFDFHPAWVKEQMSRAGFTVETARSLSHFRSPALKRLLPPHWLARLDALAQPTGRWCLLTPSVILRARPTKADTLPPSGVFRCPQCHNDQLNRRDEGFVCPSCQCLWSGDGGIYDFRTPRPLPG